MKADGLFQSWVNEHAATPGAAERELLRRLTELAREVLPGSQVRWAGSQARGTGVVGSDVDVCIETPEPVTEAQRRKLAGEVGAGLRRPTQVLSHCLRLTRTGDVPKVDVAFANAAFGSRELPNKAQFHGQPRRQAAVRGLKLWLHAAPLPPIPGWAVEALVVHLDQPSGDRHALELFRRVVGWLAETATPEAVEGVLRPAASPRWRSEWSARLPGQLDAVRNHARHLLRRAPQPETWRGREDVATWLGR